MNTQVTEQDLRNFASLGFPASVRANDETDVESLVESLMHVLQTPSARLASAAAMVLQALATTDDLEQLRRPDLPDLVRRRLGYLAERLSQDVDTPETVTRRLARFSDELHQADDNTKAPLTLMAATNPTLVRLYMKKSDRVGKKWQVFGDIDLPTYASLA